MEKNFDWKWRKLSGVSIEQRYLLIYYLINSDDDCIPYISSISNRIKFIASYIKNINNNSQIHNYYIDIPDYKVKSNIEFEYHWKKTKTIEKIIYNPVIMKTIPWIVAISLLLVLLFIVIRYKSSYQLMMKSIDRVLNYYTFNVQDSDALFYMYRKFKVNHNYYLEVSRYLKTNLHMFVFYFSWLLLQLKTYKQFIDRAYNKACIMLYFVLAFGFMTEYFFIFQDVLFRMAGGVIAIVALIISMIGHKYNMPSFREPQFNKIRKYLELDEL